MPLISVPPSSPPQPLQWFTKHDCGSPFLHRREAVHSKRRPALGSKEAHPKSSPWMWMRPGVPPMASVFLRPESPTGTKETRLRTAAVHVADFFAQPRCLYVNTTRATNILLFSLSTLFPRHSRSRKHRFPVVFGHRYHKYACIFCLEPDWRQQDTRTGATERHKR